MAPNNINYILIYPHSKIIIITISQEEPNRVDTTLQQEALLITIIVPKYIPLRQGITAPA